MKPDDGTDPADLPRPGSPTCERAREALAAASYGELGPAAAAELEAHVQACAGCREARRRLADTRRLLDAWEMPARPTASAGGAARPTPGDAPATETPVVGVPRRPAALRRAWAGVAAAAAAVLLLLSSGAHASVADGRLTLRFGLPFAPAPAVVSEAERTAEIRRVARELEERLRADQAADLARLAALLREERAAALAALEHRTALADEQLAVSAAQLVREQGERFTRLLSSFAVRSQSETDRTRDALVDLASLLAYSQ